MNELAAALPRRHRLTRADYYRMAEVGILPPNARVELIQGEIIDMPPIGARHAGAVAALHYEITTRLGRGGVVFCQNPAVLDDLSEPQPDLCVLRYRSDFYQGDLPRPADVLLVVEVADTSLAFDSTVKAQLYARAAIREYWLVDLSGRAVVVHRDPEPSGYRCVRRIISPPTLTMQAFPEISIDLGALWLGDRRDE